MLEPLRAHAVRFASVASLSLLVSSPALAAKTKAKASAAASAPAPPPAPEPPPPEPAPAAEPAPPEPTAEPAKTEPAPCAPPSPATKDTLVFLEGGFRADFGSFTRHENVGQNQQNNSDDVRAIDPMLFVGLLKRVSPVWRMGGAFGYGGNYDLNNNNQLLGQLLTLDFRVEASKDVAEHLALFVQPKVGLSAIIPGGILQERIDDNQQFGFDTWSVPRLGFLVGVDAGGRYALNDWFALRATLGYAYTMSFLLDSHASANGVSAAQTWLVQASRLSGNVGIEVGF